MSDKWLLFPSLNHCC